MGNSLLIEVESRTAILTLNRPERLNALNFELLEELETVLDQVNRDPDILGVIITGNGKAFCAGADLKERLSSFTPDSSIAGDAMLSKLRKNLNTIENMGKPFIAALNGPAYGGGVELALACDIRIMSPSAKVGLTEPKVGMIPGAGGTQRLPRLIGMAKAKELLFSAKAIDSSEAYAIGLVNRVVPEGESILQTSMEWMHNFQQNAPLAIQMVKLAVNKGGEMSLSQGLDLEAVCSAFLRTTEDRTEGIRAFQEKRPPKFKGK